MTNHDSLPPNEFEGRPELIKKRARVIIWQRVAIAIAAMYIVGSLGLLVMNAIQGQQTRNTLLDCTEPTGKCAKEGQKQTASVIKQLIDANAAGDVSTQRVVIIAAACSESPDIRSEPNQVERIRLTEECVNAQLEKERG